MKQYLLASDFDDEWSLAASSPTGQSRWKVVPERAIVTLERGRDPKIEYRNTIKFT